MDKLKHIGVVDDDMCSLCGIHFETHTHLFFECPFSLLCVAGIKDWTGIVMKPFPRMDFRKYGLSRSKQQAMTMCSMDCSIRLHYIPYLPLQE